MIGIYLMYNGDCYPDGSYFRDVAVTIPSEQTFPNSDYLRCVLPNFTLSGGEWSRSSGGPVNCTNNTDSDPFRCIITDTPANLSLYRPYGQHFSVHADQLYKCCLPTNCSDPTTNIITVHIFGELFHCTSTYCHLQ